MSLSAGERIGAYAIVGAIGAGGMGEVYRARDTKLDREVALKVLPEAFASDAERMARLRREAKLLASLNHPNIACIYGFEDSGHVHAVVMELIEGPTLAERTAIPLDDALPIARQIAEGLEYAHERGIVHRDLKPANVKVTPDGAVKLLDFGLAKAMEGDASAADLSNSPTFSRMATEAGVILGTAAYMSPEQAKGKRVDRRADIWAFGSVLYEMLTGRRAFDGETVTDVLAAVVRGEPDWTALPAATPAPIRDLLRRCLTKDARQRLRDIGDARIAIEEAESGANAAPGIGPASAGPRPVRPAAWRRAAPWALASLAVAVAATALVGGHAAGAPAPVMRFTLAPPTEGEFTTAPGAAMTLSPDGRQMVYVLHAGEKDQLYLHSLDRDHAGLLPGTEGAFAPFFSPDGQWVAFFAQQKLKKVAVSGGMAVTLCDAPDARGGDWGPDDNILFTPTANSPLERVSANGGAPAPVTKLNSAPEGDSRSHRWPSLLPDGTHALFNVVYHVGNPLDHSDIGVVSLATGEYKILIRGGSYPRFVPAGYLIYAVGTDMLAVPFDPRTLTVTGTPVTVVKGVRTALYSGGAEFAFSSAGVLAYLPANDRPPAMDRLVRVDRKGVAQPITTTLHAYANPRVLPDGKRIVLEITDQTRGIWLHDSARNTLGPLAIESSDTSPVLTPDGENVIFNSIRNGSEGLWIKRVDGSGAEENLTATTSLQLPNSVSPDGRSIAYTAATTARRSVLLVLPREAPHKPQPLLPGLGSRSAAAYSPDGRWIAYVSDESGRPEVYVGAASGHGATWPVSSGGGGEPVWARGGRELFYRAGNKMMAVAVRSGDAFASGAAVELFEADFDHNEGVDSQSPDYDVSPDGQHFVMIQPTGPAAAAPTPAGLRIVLNWFQDLPVRPK
jgi:eukaryotic-like serine/threonine-protein kinase